MVISLQKQEHMVDELLQRFKKKASVYTRKYVTNGMFVVLLQQSDSTRTRHVGGMLEYSLHSQDTA